MCDDVTETEATAFLQGTPRQSAAMSRRNFGRASAAAATLAVVPGCMAKPAPRRAAGKTASRKVTITTPDGTADALFVYPRKGTNAGRHAAVVMWPDIAGLRDAYIAMGTRLAEAGYAVLVVNQYYRSAPAPILNTMAEWRTDAGQAKLKPMIAAITPDGITRDAGAFVAWLDRQAEVDTAKKIGTCGYCMGGPYTFRTAAAAPARVGAVASFHGASLVTETPDSPHLLIAKSQAAYLIAIAQNDDERQPDAKTVLRAAADAAKRAAEIEVYPAQHGWCTIDAPVYDKVQAERAWARMLALYQQAL
ncbi:dienelactone hydrolase family protein [Novosphingobium lentum]|uniref:dienelactone hydrolase family protein n=1 Tax=Novosphingobium lentum TaxID=145287 RepID=UPI00083789FE|nr:dienelactone hydrolase family protein [Novosphingobium lentum]